jgi:predicted metalloenzyme YecM
MNIIGDYKSFLNKIFSNLEKAGFGESEFKELDHICYRVETMERYEEVKKGLEEFCSKSTEAEISGRPIFVCRLKEPLKYKHYEIRCLEVSAPRKDMFFQEGLEHAEFITKKKLSEFLEEHKNVNFNMSAYSKEINPELILEFGESAAKFHEQSLLEIRQM